jgi:hypothetical protein
MDLSASLNSEPPQVSKQACNALHKLGCAFDGDTTGETTGTNQLSVFRPNLLQQTHDSALTAQTPGRLRFVSLLLKLSMYLFRMLLPTVGLCCFRCILPWSNAFPFLWITDGQGKQGRATGSVMFDDSSSLPNTITGGNRSTCRYYHAECSACFTSQEQQCPVGSPVGYFGHC